MNKQQLVFAFSAATGLLLLRYFYKRLVKKSPTPAPVDTRNWEYVGTVEQITIYPIKSCAGTELFFAKCGKYGLESYNMRDRWLVLIEDNGVVCSAGRYPKMLQIESDIICEDTLLVYAPSMEPLHLVISKMVKEGKEVFKIIDDDRVPLIQCDVMYDWWFSMFLLGKESGIRLFVRVSPERGRELIGKNQDLNPYMVITDESVTNLNARLSNPIHHMQFRGNFLISTHLPAFAEDNWKWMRIGHDATFRYKAPCYRCIIPNINPFTGERSRDFEPLKTLQRFRTRPGQKEPEMGIYFDLDTEGEIHYGDPVFAVM